MAGKALAFSSEKLDDLLWPYILEDVTLPIAALWEHQILQNSDYFYKFA